MFAQQEGGWGKLRYEAVGFRSGEQKGGNEWRQALFSAVSLWHCLATCQTKFAACQAAACAGTSRRGAQTCRWGLVEEETVKVLLALQFFFFVQHSNKMANKKMFDIWPLAGDHQTTTNEMKLCMQSTN